MGSLKFRELEPDGANGESYLIVSYTHSTQGDATCQAVCMHLEVAVQSCHAFYVRWRSMSHLLALCHTLLAVAYTGQDCVGCWHIFPSLGEQTMGAKIIDRGRGPEIEGTRITVYDVMDYLQEGWRYDQIAGLFRLPPDDIQTAIAYSEAHREAVTTAYRQSLARHRNVQYTPEVQAKLAHNRQKLQAKLAEIRARQQGESAHAHDHGGS